jgi:hypothetical protein
MSKINLSLSCSICEVEYGFDCPSNFLSTCPTCYIEYSHRQREVIIKRVEGCQKVTCANYVKCITLGVL